MVPRFTSGADVQTRTIPNTALIAIPIFVSARRNREKTWVKSAMAEAATMNVKTIKPLCTRTYRALRRSSTGSCITRYFTTA